MEIGDKIRSFRELRGLTQDQLGKLSGINGGTIRKYELGIRNPKQDQLIKIANGLGIGVSVFYDFDLETLGDVATILFLIDDNAPIKFVGEKGPDGNYRSGNVSIQFENKTLNRFLGEWADLDEILSKAKADSNVDTIEGLPVDTWIEETKKVFRLRQMQSSIMLDKSDGIKVRIENKKKD